MVHQFNFGYITGYQNQGQLQHIVISQIQQRNILGMKLLNLFCQMEHEKWRN